MPLLVAPVADQPGREAAAVDETTPGARAPATTLLTQGNRVVLGPGVVRIHDHPGERQLPEHPVHRGPTGLGQMQPQEPIGDDHALGRRYRGHCMRSSNLPGFLGLGAQKAGTTTLQMLLASHPQVFLPDCKEVHYFSLHYARGLKWYQSHYLEAPEGSLAGDITPYYLFHPEAPLRIHGLLPEAKLIILLRDPVERSLSQYFHSVRLGLEHLPLEEAFVAEQSRLQGSEKALQPATGWHRSHQEHSYLARSRYEVQLDRYRKLFDSDQILILRSEDLFHDTQKPWSCLIEFLGLDPCPLPQRNTRSNSGAGEASGVSLEFRQKLRLSLATTYQRMASDYGIAW